jgi:hypothetical protein
MLLISFGYRCEENPFGSPHGEEIRLGKNYNSKSKAVF